MYFNLKFGDNQSFLINSNCKVLNLLKYIRAIANLDESIEIELSDLSGEVKHLQDAKFAYATHLLKEKETYVLLKVERKNNNDSKGFYVALLNNEQIVNEDFLLKLNSINKKKQNLERSRIGKSKTSLSSQQAVGQIQQPQQQQQHLQQQLQQQSRTKRNSSFAQSVASSSLNASFNEIDPSPKPTYRNSREFDFE